MKPIFAIAGLASLALFAAAYAAAADDMTVPPYVAAAVADQSRPQADRDRDADRHPAEVIAFSGVRPGWKIADIIAGTGYFSRIFGAAVGPSGHVYAFFPAELKNFRPGPLPPNGVAIYPGVPNVTTLVSPVNAFAPPEPLDLVWISDNYHDLHDPFFAPADLAVINKAVFNALKPGGVYLVLDHRAPAGAGLSDTNTLHRIDEASVKAEVEAAGFRLVGESDVLHNPSDPLTKAIFDPSIRGKTDQFILKFRKPGA